MDVPVFADALSLGLHALDHWVALLPLVLLWLGMAGLIGVGAGFHHLFRDGEHIIYVTDARGRLDRAHWGEKRPAFSTLLASPAFWTSLGVSVLGGLVWLRLWYARPPADPGWWVWLAVQGGVIAAYWHAARLSLRRPRIDVAVKPKADVQEELGRCLLGGAAGAGVVAAVHVVALAMTGNAPASPLLWIHLMGLGLTVIAFAVPYLVTGLAVIALAIGLVSALGLVDVVLGPHAEVAVLVMLGALVLGNGRLFKARIPDLDYDAALAAVVSPAEAPAPMAQQNPNRTEGLAPNPAKIPLLEPLEAWHARMRAAGQERPVLVVLATSGGAYRASFWTALVLDRLAAEAGQGQRFAGLPGNLRLIAGASGGMVAGAYFTALSHARGGTPPRDIADAIAQDTVEFQRGAGDGPMQGRKRRIPIPRDSLSPVVQQFIRRDLPGAFRPGLRRYDRGRMLEDQWLTLRRRFGDIVQSEREGLCPSIVFSPMLVETGSVAYLSNLDLRPIRLQRLQPLQAETVVNEDSVELMDAFPQHAPKLRLATAVRLNATFPYVSPALSLPVFPNRRVVDSGYYDNYGGDLIAGWLATPEVRDWITEHCAGVAILQVRAFTRDDALEARASRVARAFQGITSPPEGLLNARVASQVLRNNQQLKLVEQLYQEDLRRPGDAPPFIRRFVFEAYADASMSWHLPDGDLESLRRLLPAHEGFSLRHSLPEIAADRDATDRLAQRRRAYVRQQAVLAREFDRLAAFWAECATQGDALP